MKFRLYALLALATTMGLVACSEDPTAAGSGTPVAIISNRTTTTATLGTKFSLTTYVIDQNAQRMEGALTATTSGTNIAIDSVVYVKETLETKIFINPKTATSTGNVITVSGHGLTKDITVKVS
jgi:hypothetical protein